MRLTPEHPGALAGRPLRARLAGGERLIGTFVKSRDPATTEALAAAGYDFVVADMEHSPLAVADVEQGDMLVVPSGVLHYAVAGGDEPMVDLSVFNPRRDDYFAIDEGEANA